MTISIRHPFVSAKGDGGDATLVRPSNWNANHTTSMDTLKILGRLTAGVGAFEELPTSAYMIAALASADKAALLAALGIGVFETGDVKFSVHPTAPTGWIAYNGQGTISKAGAGGTVLADATAQPLYELIYNNIIDTWCPVSGGRTGSAGDDFNAGKTIALPRFSGRALIGAGTGSGLTARVSGQYAGFETHTLTVPEMPAHSHNNSLGDSGHIHNITGGRGVAGDFNNNGGGGGPFSAMGNGGIIADNAGSGVTISNASIGGGGSHNNMQPFIALWAKVKL